MLSVLSHSPRLSSSPKYPARANSLNDASFYQDLSPNEKGGSEQRDATSLHINDPNGLLHSEIPQLAAFAFIVIAGVAHVFATKAVLQSSRTPILLLCAQTWTETALLALWKLFALKKPSPRFTFDGICATLPVAAVNVTSLLLGAKALQHLDLTVFVVAQALHAPFSIVCSRIFLGASATSSSVSSVLIIIAFGLVYVTEPGSRLWSMTIAAVSALARAFEPTCVKRAERTLGDHVTTADLDWYSTLSTAAILAVLAVASGEFGSVLDMVDIVLDGRADGIGQARILEGVQASLATFALGALVVSLFSFLRFIAPTIGVRLTAPFLQMIALATRCLLIISLSLSLVQDQLTLPRVMALSAMVAGLVLGVPLRASAGSLPFTNSPSRSERNSPSNSPSVQRSRTSTLSPSTANETSPRLSSAVLPSPPAALQSPSTGSLATFQRRLSATFAISDSDAQPKQA